MDDKIILAALGMVFTTAMIGGVSINMLIRKNKSISLEEISSLREEMFELSKTNERARIELEESKNRRMRSVKSVNEESDRLQKAISEIKENQRKVAFTELSKLREELHELSLISDIAKRELQTSHTRRVSTEETVIKEINRLKNIIKEIRESNRKQLFDKLTKSRDRLYRLANYSDEANVILNDSYELTIVSDEDIERECLRLGKAIKDAEDLKRRVLLNELTEVRNRLYGLVLVSDQAKIELEASYNRKIISEDDMFDEIGKLKNIILDVNEKRRKEIFNELDNVRDELYKKSKTNDGVRMDLEDSYNKILDDKLAVKEIDRLTNTKERIDREEEINKYRNKLFGFMKNIFMGTF